MNKGTKNHRYLSDSASSSTDKKKIILILAAIVIVAVIILAVVLILRSCNKSDDSAAEPTATEQPTSSVLPTVAVKGTPIESPEDVQGSWTLDGVTTYEFSDDSTGALKTDTDDLMFSYTVEGNVLSLDFENDSVNDASYACNIDGDTLYFDDISTQQTYILTRK